MTTEGRKPYGPKYMEMVAKVALNDGCGGNEMGILYRLFMKFDWESGETPSPYSHRSLAADMGISYNTAKKCIARLIKAGVLTYARNRGRGVKWSDGSGHANRYAWSIPAVDPVQKTTRPQPKKRPDPSTKNGQHYHNLSLSREDEASASRGHVDKVPDPNRADELASFSELVTRHSYAVARQIWDKAKMEPADG